ncbi:hypothetical protein FisN_40Lh026 [Fistulifera solaris]|uniref:Uncharacterized protein n=1 Tax=Fistulifera solaris TaxID=1519565 RepID=A0A1Z5J996_FISSO|nr:hypothetical protein FisN_40Lh026 [Fistulifera solaris]|eukprot:GAX10555.1 hypothetical protein FisN_40Lh026 [Fistulifera solaris]
MTATTETQSSSWLRNIKRLNCVNGAHTLSKRVMNLDYYSHLPDPKSPNPTSGRDITEATESVNSNRDANSSTFKKDEKVKKTVSFGSEIWSDGMVRSRGRWMTTSHESVRSDKSRRSKGIPNEVMCSDECRDVVATPDFGKDESSRASPTPSETGSDIDQETLREARKFILSAKLLLLSLEKKDGYHAEDTREDENIIVQSDDSMQSEESNPDRTRDEDTITELLDENLEYNDQNETGSLVEVGLDTQMMEELNVDQNEQRIIVETTHLSVKEGGFTDRDYCPSPPAIRRVFLKDGLMTMDATKGLTDETRSHVGLSVVASNQTMHCTSNVNTTKKQSSSTSNADTMSSLSADPVPKLPPLSCTVGSVSVAERVRRWSQAHANARGNMDNLAIKQKGFFWRSHPSQDQRQR